MLHTKVRNRLSHKKLNKLVYVNYNLRLRLEEVSGPLMREEGDFIDQLAHLSFYDENNPVREWMEYGRSNRAPVLDEDDDDGDIPLPSHIVRDQINVSDLREATGNDSISDWARQNIGDTHLGKRKLQKGPKKGDSMRRKGKQIAKPVSSDTETDDGEGERSPPYQESQDSSSAMMVMMVTVLILMLEVVVVVLMLLLLVVVVLVVFVSQVYITHINRHIFLTMSIDY